MQIDRSHVLDTLRERGDDDAATRAEQSLPATVDTDRDADALADLGLSSGDLKATETGTELGSGQGSGLGISHQSEPESLTDPTT